MATTVTKKGQVSIPKPIRERLGIEPGNAVDFELAPDGRVVLIKVGGERPTSRFEALRGQAGKVVQTKLSLSRAARNERNTGRYRRIATASFKLRRAGVIVMIGTALAATIIDQAPKGIEQI